MIKQGFFYKLLCFSCLISCGITEKKRRQADNYYNLAVSHLEKCDKPRALKHLLKAQSLKPKDFLIQHALATIYFSMNKKERAEKLFKDIIKNRPKFTEARVDMARIYLDRGAISLAAKNLEQASLDMTYTNSRKLISLKGELWFRKKKWKQAQKWLLEARSLPGPPGCFVYSYLGRVSYKLKDYKSSERYLKQASRVCEKDSPRCEPRSFNEQYYLAKTYLKMQNLKLARYHFKIFMKQTWKKNKLRKEARKYLEKL